MSPTKSQVKNLGHRLRHGVSREGDLDLLDEFCLSFEGPFKAVMAVLADLGLEPVGRQHKTTLSIVAKLQRQQTNLANMQDIAGCRVVVPTIALQEKAVQLIRAQFPGCKVDDKRGEPNYHYRAVHLIVRIDGMPIEIQVRTTLQHLWATFSERLADDMGSEVKYGGGDPRVQKILGAASKRVEDVEASEVSMASINLDDSRFPELKLALEGARQEVTDGLRSVITLVESWRQES